MPRSSAQMQRGSTARRRANHMLGTTVVPPTTERREKSPNTFAATIIPYSNKQIARIADCSIDAAKLWRSGRRFPQYEYIKRLRALPEVRAWLAKDLGFKIGGLVAELQQLAGDSTPEAAEARATLRALMRD